MVWHYTSMRAILLLSFLFASCALADETADRLAIGRTIAALNEVPQRPGLFTEDGDSSFAVKPLLGSQPVSVRLLTTSGNPVPAPPAHATVEISNEPWGEATIIYPGMPSLPPMEMLDPRIVSGTIRFITADVALVDGAYTYRAEKTPLLFVMKKEKDNNWKIASLRVLAPR